MNRWIPWIAWAALVACTGERRPAEQPSPEVTPTEDLTASPEVASSEPGQVSPALSAATCLGFEPAGASTVSGTRAVKVCAELLGARPGQKLAAEFISPRGMPYERREATLSGSPRDLQRAEFELLVAGTMIDTSRLSGQWKVKFLLDGALVATQPFTLAP